MKTVEKAGGRTQGSGVKYAWGFVLASHFISLSLSFMTCKMEQIFLAWEECCGNLVKATVWEHDGGKCYS